MLLLPHFLWGFFLAPLVVRDTPKSALLPG